MKGAPIAPPKRACADCGQPTSPHMRRVRPGDRKHFEAYKGYGASWLCPACYEAGLQRLWSPPQEGG